MKRLVVLGGGYGGLKTVLGLLEHHLPEDVHITIIDRNPYHSVKTEFFTIAAGTVAERDVRMDFPDDKRVHYEYGEITKIDTTKQEILIKGKTDHVPYDYMVIGLGCEDNYHDVEGAEEFTESVQTFSKARHTGLAVGNLKAYGKVTIVGAGLSGIEVASEIRESRSDLNIRILDRGTSVLKAFDSKIQEHVHEWFIKNDVDVLHNSNVEYVEKDGVCNNGLCFVNDVTIWTAGVRPNFLARELPFEKDTQEKIIVNDFFQVPSHPNVYVVGDCASSVHSPSAQLAGQQGELVADVLLAVLKERTPKRPKEIKLKGTLGSLGKSDGFGNMMERAVTGYLPRLAKSGVLWLNKRH
ncbi:FAD-dependent oxidoreductase [Virgibacillus profundi]|uniref:FAD-dependent oxidoreductase n=1 Tax=Virgibacillus profundi TaxID=2024555 RepID=A0A2A2IHV6_9BACI|nr:FAD-dependent oxidoreductase [Virgibacillus profundi]PAV31581.1 FAD-dependent oxidoreductase [Virgibacillus profundi]PXY55767.1 FAD-dependent oxidoreductase [Virgibacillus profundi]